MKAGFFTAQGHIPEANAKGLTPDEMKTIMKIGEDAVKRTMAVAMLKAVGAGEDVDDEPPEDAPEDRPAANNAMGQRAGVLQARDKGNDDHEDSKPSGDRGVNVNEGRTASPLRPKGVL